MNPSDRRPVAVSELAQLARCEQQVLLDQTHGKQRPPERERLAAAGEREHARHDQLARRYQGRPAARDRRCFIASALYGETAWQTEVLRTWRDRVLQPTGWGRVLIAGYYRLSPPLARFLMTHPRLAQCLRGGLDRFIHHLDKEIAP